MRSSNWFLIIGLTQAFIYTVSAQRQTTGQAIANSTIPNRHRIVGGVETERNEYPFIVSLFRKSQLAGHFCGGSIIDRHWVITAAHCVTQPDFNLTAGEHDLRKPEGTEQMVKAVKVIQHPKYNRATFENDIALVKVFPPFNYTKFVKHFQLPSIHFVAAGNVTTAGWGVVAEGSTEVSPVLRKVTVGVFPNLECSKTYGNDFHMDKMICAGEPDGGKDACQGDSGGPLMCEEARFGDTLCGIVSFGFGCARPEFAGVYTKVAYYTDWVTWEQGKDTNPNMPDPRLTSTTRKRYFGTTSTTRPSTEDIPSTTRRRRRIRIGGGSSSSSVNSISWNFYIFCIITVTSLNVFFVKNNYAKFG